MHRQLRELASVVDKQKQDDGNVYNGDILEDVAQHELHLLLPEAEQRVFRCGPFGASRSRENTKNLVTVVPEVLALISCPPLDSSRVHSQRLWTSMAKHGESVSTVFQQEVILRALITA